MVSTGKMTPNTTTHHAGRSKRTPSTAWQVCTGECSWGYRRSASGEGRGLARVEWGPFLTPAMPRGGAGALTPSASAPWRRLRRRGGGAGGGGLRLVTGDARPPRTGPAAAAAAAEDADRGLRRQRPPGSRKQLGRGGGRDEGPRRRGMRVRARAVAAARSGKMAERPRCGPAARPTPRRPQPWRREESRPAATAEAGGWCEPSCMYPVEGGCA